MSRLLLAAVAPTGMTAPAAPSFYSPRHPREIESDMMDILLSMPMFYLYLAFVVTLLIVAVRTRQTDRPGVEPRAAALTTGRSVAEAVVAGRRNLDRPWRDSAWPPQRDRRLFRDLEASLSACYAVRLERAIRTIRVGPPVED
jgi:hypothetical protein